MIVRLMFYYQLLNNFSSSFCFRILTANNTNPDILFATNFILIQMTATVTSLLLFVPKVMQLKFLIEPVYTNLDQSIIEELNLHQPGLPSCVAG